ncbi:hypothetical protein SBV1_1420039 [Verrucomicrobia bacterium]|nr:hypothetical protein SBV1_1420039 [Verrucomicrobiota bacterium]
MPQELSFQPSLVLPDKPMGLIERAAARYGHFGCSVGAQAHNEAPSARMPDQAQSDNPCAQAQPMLAHSALSGWPDRHFDLHLRSIPSSALDQNPKFQTERTAGRGALYWEILQEGLGTFWQIFTLIGLGRWACCGRMGTRGRVILGVPGRSLDYRLIRSSASVIASSRGMALARSGLSRYFRLS